MGIGRCVKTSRPFSRGDLSIKVKFTVNYGEQILGIWLVTAQQRASLIYWGSQSNETPSQFTMKNYWVWLYIPTSFSQMNPMWLNLVMQLMLLYLPPWNISTQCSTRRLFGSPASQRQFPVSCVVWIIQAFVSLDQHHLCQKYLKPMNHRLLLSALFCSCVMTAVMFLKYTYSPSVCMETRPS